MRRSVMCAAAVVVAFIGLGCQSDQQVIERVQRPAEINMAGRESVTVEPIRGDNREAITARLKSALQSGGFTILDRGSALAARNREASIDSTGQMESAEVGSIARANVQIKGSVTRHNTTSSVEEGQQTRDGMRYRVYQTLGAANVGVNFEVIDLETTRTITTVPITAVIEAKSDWMSQPVQLDMSPQFERAYDEVVAKFMQKIAPYSETVAHTVYPIKDVPQTNSGIAMLQSNPRDAVREFEAALAMAQTLPKVKPATLGMITHNIGVAYEMSGQFDAAIAKYTQAAGMGGKLDEGGNISRVQGRKADIAKLKDQGVIRN